jgi:hydroxymethylglutaryl-CoA reductase
MTLPSLLVGTVGGGTSLPTQAEALRLLDCLGAGKKARLAEIIAGFCLALDLSTWSAIAAHVFTDAHKRLGRR